MSRTSLLSVCLAPGLAIPAAAQDARATITGTVTDPSGAIISGVQIRVTSTERGTVTEASSNEAGL